MGKKKVIAYLGDVSPRDVVGNDLMRTFTDPDTGIETHIGVYGLGCRLPCDAGVLDAASTELNAVYG